MPLCHTTIEDSSLLLTNDVRHVTANQIKSVLLCICCPYFKPNMTILVANFCWKKRDHTIITSQAFRTIIFLCEGSPGIRNGGGKSWFWTPSWLFLTSWTCGFSVFYVKEASCLISSSSATFTLSSFSSSMTSLISSSTCPILTFYTFLESSDQMPVNGEEKISWFDGLHTVTSDFHFVMKVIQRFKTRT